MTQIEISRRIRELRQAKGWSQSHLGDLCGLSKNTIINCEKAGSRPTIATAQKIAKALGVEIGELIG